MPYSSLTVPYVRMAPQGGLVATNLQGICGIALGGAIMAARTQA